MRRITFDPDALGTEDYITNLQFSRDGKTLAGIVRDRIGHRDLRIIRFDWQQEIALPNAHDYDIAVDTLDEATPVIWCPDLEVLAEHYLNESGFRNVRLVDFWSKPINEVAVSEDFPMQCFAFSVDGSQLYMAGTTWPEAEHQIRIYSVEKLLEQDEDAQLETLQPDSLDTVTSLAGSPNKRWLAWGFESGVVVLHDTLAERLKQKFRAFGQQPKPIEMLQFSPRSDGLLALVSGAVAVWSMDDVEPKVIRSRSPFCSATYLPDGTVLAATEAGDVVWIDAKTGAEFKRFNFTVGAVSGMAVDPDGLTAALGCTGGIVFLFDLE